jgi:arylamine N-acetyltransferase
LGALPDVYQRYLRVLGIEGFPSGIDGLRTVVRAHLLRAPFENISKLLLVAREGRARFLSLGEFLEGIEKQDLGGTCYSCNPYLASLLRALGYETDILGADMGRGSNVHTCLRVRIQSVAYHVDVGYGGPFREPIRLDRLPFELMEGSHRYVLDHREAGGDADSYEMSVFDGEERVHGYVVHNPPRTLEFFTGPMQDSFALQATFLNCLRICRFFDTHSVTLLNRTLSIHREGQTTRSELASLAEWESAFTTHLRMRRCPGRAAIPILEQITGKPFFDAKAAVR